MYRMSITYKISVIMGIYNCKNIDALKESILSIINQTYENWELIICNDGSTDNTLYEINQLARLDNRIKVISYDENGSLAKALNACLEVAEGDFIARQDDDDISYANRFEDQLQFLLDNPSYGFVGSTADIYNENGIWGCYTIPKEPTKKSFLLGNPFAHPTVMFRKQCLLDVGGYRVVKETRRSEDYDLFMRLYASNYKGYNIQENLYKYYVKNGKENHRPIEFRVDEALVRFKGYKEMGILFPGVFFVLKPILVGIIPMSIYRLIKQIKYKK